MRPARWLLTLVVLSVVAPSCSRIYGVSIYGDAERAAQLALRSAVLNAHPVRPVAMHLDTAALAPECGYFDLTLKGSAVRVALTECFRSTEDSPTGWQYFVALQPPRSIEERADALAELQSLVAEIVGVFHASGATNVKTRYWGSLEKRVGRT